MLQMGIIKKVEITIQDMNDDKTLLEVENVYSVLLAGGTGSRLWPVSRRAYPKPFMRMADGQTLAEKTLRRAMGLAGVRDVLTVTGRDAAIRAEHFELMRITI